MNRPYATKSPGDLMRRLVFDYARYGYVRISVFEIPERKEGEGERIDEKIIENYGITYCRTTRMLRRRQGEASVVHLRLKRWIVLLSTDGKHRQEGRVKWHDIREKPLTLWGYSIGSDNGKPTVRVAERKWKRVREAAHRIALHHEKRVSYFFQVWLERIIGFNHPGVIRQKMKLRNEVNHRRGAAGLPKVRRPRKSLPTVTRQTFAAAVK